MYPQPHTVAFAHVMPETCAAWCCSTQDMSGILRTQKERSRPTGVATMNSGFTMCKNLMSVTTYKRIFVAKVCLFA